jgi:menaquinone-specific isochorismate synthase
MEPLRGDEPTALDNGDTLVTRGCRLGSVPRRQVLGLGESPTIAWESPSGAVAAAGEAARIATDGRDRFAAVRDATTALFDGRDVPADLPAAARPRLFGGLSFHAGDDPGGDDVWAGFPDALFVLPAVQVTETTGGTWLTVNTSGPDATVRANRSLASWRERLSALPATAPRSKPGRSAVTPTPSREGWNRQVRDAVSAIRRGELTKVVLAQALRAELDTPLSVPDTLARLGETYRDCYRFAFSPNPETAFFGATPEQLVSRRGRTVSTVALAGSTGRGDTPAEDRALAEELREHDKDVHEHELVAEAIRGQLAPFADVQSGTRGVRRLATVQHLETPISATLRQETHVLDLVEALHPTPAVGGLPPNEALRTIREHETFDRGWYAAPVGWLDANGHGTFVVAIRSAVARPAAATLFAGAGIVADSDPDREWAELQLKFRPILDQLE